MSEIDNQNNEKLSSIVDDIDSFVRGVGKKLADIGLQESIQIISSGWSTLIEKLKTK